MKLPNDLIKSTDYDKAKDREIHEFECVNGKVIQHYALGGEHELTMQEIVDCLNALTTIDCDLQTAYAYIKGQEENIKITEKALEIACLVISKAMCPNGDWETLKIDFANAYKEQAEREMMKSE